MIDPACQMNKSDNEEWPTADRLIAEYRAAFRITGPLTIAEKHALLEEGIVLTSFGSPDHQGPQESRIIEGVGNSPFAKYEIYCAWCRVYWVQVYHREKAAGGGGPTRWLRSHQKRCNGQHKPPAAL